MQLLRFVLIRPLAVFSVGVTLAAATPGVAAPLLPDLTAIEGGIFNAMHDGVFTNGYNSNKPKSQYRSLYQFSAALPNIGAGPFEIREETDADDTQTIYQRIHDSDGSVVERMVGVFPHADPGFGHLFFKGLAQYNLRSVTPDVGNGPGVGEVLSSHDKTSFGLADSAAYDSSLPGAPSTPHYTDINGPLIGVSVGWLDLYGKGIQGQWVDATGLPDGEYWLEVVVDPYDLVEELDETNNSVRVIVELTVIPPEYQPADFDFDNDVDATDLSSWEGGFGALYGALHVNGDADADDAVTGGDFLVWQQQFQQPAVATSVPEPTSWLIALMGIAALARRRRCRFRSGFAAPRGMRLCNRAVREIEMPTT